MADLYETIESKVLDAIDADEAGDTERALQLMQQAQLALSILPDGKNEDSEMAFDREAIAKAVTELKKKNNARGGKNGGGVIAEHVRFERG